jgi:hypothetical protein
LNARTGLFTPPGRMFVAREKSRADLVVRIFTTKDTKDTKGSPLWFSLYAIARAASRA